MPVTRRGAKGRLIDLAIYLAIAFGVVGLAAFFAVRAARTGGSGTLPIKWIGFAGETAMVFGYVLRGARRYWRKSRFWAGYLVFLTAHSVGFTIVLLRVDPFPLVWFILLGYAEFIALAYVLDLLLREPAQSDPRQR